MIIIKMACDKNLRWWAATHPAALSAIYSMALAEEAEEDARSDSRAYDSGYIRCHGLHEEMVAWIAFPSDSLRNACAVRDGGYSRIADERVDLVAFFEEKVPDLDEQHSRDCCDDE